MEVNYGPSVDGIRIKPEPEDKDMLAESATACLYVVQAVGAHRPTSEMVEVFSDAQQMCVELARLRNHDGRGVYAGVDEIAAVATAMGWRAAIERDPPTRSAAGAWGEPLGDILAATDATARDYATRDDKQVPPDPWDIEGLGGESE